MRSTSSLAYHSIYFSPQAIIFIDQRIIGTNLITTLRVVLGDLKIDYMSAVRFAGNTNCFRCVYILGNNIDIVLQ